MDAIQDFEDLLDLLSTHGVRYLIVGGLAFIYHAKPRYTKDIDLWIDPQPENVALANAALVEFGSPALITADRGGSQPYQYSSGPGGISVCPGLGQSY